MTFISTTRTHCPPPVHAWAVSDFHTPQPTFKKPNPTQPETAYLTTCSPLLYFMEDIEKSTQNIKSSYGYLTNALWLIEISDQSIKKKNLTQRPHKQSRRNKS